MAMILSLITAYYFIHNARVWLNSQTCTNHYGQHFISVSNQDIFARWLSTLSSGEGPQLNNSKWVYKHIQKLQTQAAYKQICSGCTLYYRKHLIFMTCGTRSGPHCCFFPNPSSPVSIRKSETEQLEFMREKQFLCHFLTMLWHVCWFS